jgi:hypothetical protein
MCRLRGRRRLVSERCKGRVNLRADSGHANSAQQPGAGGSPSLLNIDKFDALFFIALPLCERFNAFGQRRTWAGKP